MQAIATPLDPTPWLKLTLTPDISLADQLALLARFESAERVFTAARDDIAAVVGDAGADALERGPAAGAIDKALGWIHQPNHHLIVLAGETYPRAVREIARPPCVLYAQGRVELLQSPAFAVVGSRNATLQGVRDAESFSASLSHCGFAIVSGLALGIDAAAHRGGLSAAGSSIAVVGTGADRIYPRANEALAHRLAHEGLVLSEFALGTGPHAGNFPRRNRLISGLARGVLVVEAALESGSLITARFAAEQGRDVFAIPGPIHSPLAKGCHQMIKEGAKLVDCAEDIVTELAWPMCASLPSRDDGPHSRDALLQAIGHSPMSIDQIVERTGAAAGDVAARLALLELDGVIAPLAGGFYQRLSTLRSPANA
jgi:DNA processing protein